MQATMETILACLNHFPLFAIMLRIKDPDRLPGGLRLEVCPERFFFDRATPLRWVVSSLRSVSAEYPPQPAPAYTSDVGGRSGPQFADTGGIVSSGLLRHHSVDGSQVPYRQPSHTSGTSNVYENHLQYSQHTPLHLQSHLGQQGLLGSSEYSSNMEHERIPRSTSYLFLTVSLLLRHTLSSRGGCNFSLEIPKLTLFLLFYTMLIELAVATTGYILPILCTLEATFFSLLYPTRPQVLTLGRNHPFYP